MAISEMLKIVERHFYLTKRQFLTELSIKTAEKPPDFEAFRGCF
jgi:hypothetical protein